MGCDGGTIPKRHELIRTKKKAEAKDKDVELAVKWRHCNLSAHPLKEPIVACELGRLYNKDAVIEYLLDKKSVSKPEKMSHITGLKDIHTLVLAKNPSWKSSAEKGDGYIDTHKAKYICPVAGIEMNGRYKFCYLLKCNCVMSLRALKQVRGERCPSCSKEYSKENDVVILNCSEEEEPSQKARMEQRKEAAKAAKAKAKKAKASIPDAASETLKQSSSQIKPKVKTSASSSGRVKDLKTFSTVQGAKHKLQEEKIFQTEAFKSLFTSHSSAKRAKDKNGHWITYNPYHYAG